MIRGIILFFFRVYPSSIQSIKQIGILIRNFMLERKCREPRKKVCKG